MIDYKTMLIVDEGLRYTAYKDTVGKTTVGIGFNMDDPKAKGIWIKADIPESFNAVYNGSVALSDDSVNALLDTCVTIFNKELLILFPLLNAYPYYVQLGLLNLIYNMGADTLSKFNTFFKLIRNNDYDGAADDLDTTKWADELPNRAKRVIALFKGDDSGYTSYPVSSSTSDS